ncbi:MAG: hypothetical protein KAI81_09095, partial [Candidatus Marinimicrobia bacterium]|nr:hypothetical protein [Candidatus Neomarinimicrobiota bacterium]
MSFTVNSCTSNITYLRYNEYSDAWEFTTHRDTLKNPDWRALRSGEDNSKINSSEEAEAIKEIYNSRFLKVPAELAIFYALSGEISHPYLSGKKYFKGMDYYKKRQFKDAVREFEGAKLIDGNLKYLSDVDYLIGLSYDALDMDY